MKKELTTANCIMEAIDNKMVKVTDVELYYKNSHELKTIQPNIFVDELKSLCKLELFNEMADFEYELICTQEQIDNERIKILCGYKNYVFPYCINFVLNLNKNVCKSLNDLEKILSKK